MPQEQNVLKCFSCETFQVHIVKKSKKWECKICGVKQSFKRSYGQGSGKDCRLHVMKLNELRLKKDSNVEESFFNQSCDMNNVDDVNKKANSIEIKPVTNKWLQYVDEDELEDVDLDYEETDLKKNYKKRKRMDDRQLICENNFKKICHPKGANEKFKLPQEISSKSNELDLKRNEDSTIYSKELKGLKEGENSELKDEVKLEKKKKDLFHCVKKSSNIFSSNPNDLEDLINISF